MDQVVAEGRGGEEGGRVVMGEREREIEGRGGEGRRENDGATSTEGRRTGGEPSLTISLVMGVMGSGMGDGMMNGLFWCGCWWWIDASSRPKPLKPPSIASFLLRCC